ncbi:MAG: enoyl-CoA hydratase/isomerase family protein [Pseudomonadales bacterium]|nr:enoyl-CoA hydratase/isomerase family protein [Pseudomonadales bacterium]MCP5183812.1 enoyl-CoA hydratase/isomerase family protein [Pseudomonadales bacterium]
MSDVELEIEDPVGLIRLNRPERLNAFTYDMLARIRDAVEACASDPRVVGIVITGTGRGFSAGLDSGTLAAVTGESGARDTAPSTALPGIFSYLLEVPKPIVAAVNGVAAGGGLILAMMSDLRIAAADASFTTVFLKRGLIAEHGSSWLLPRLVGVGRALDLLWASDRIDAATAREYGLVEKVVPPEQLLESARDYVRNLATTSAPAAIAETKRLVYRHLGLGYEAALREAEASQWRFVASDDAREGARALIEKRAPNFSRLG